MSFNKLKNWLKSYISLILTVVVWGMFFVASTNPAQAVTSKSTDREVSLNKIQDKIDSVVDSNSRGMKEVTKQAQKVLNEVQSGADAGKIISPNRY